MKIPVLVFDLSGQSRYLSHKDANTSKNDLGIICRQRAIDTVSDIGQTPSTVCYCVFLPELITQIVKD